MQSQSALRRMALGASRRTRAPAAAAVMLGIGSCLLARTFVGFGPAAGRSTKTARAFFAAAPTGSESPIPDAPAPDAKHFVTGNKMYPPWPAGMEEAMLGGGCFWCTENLYMKMDGVYSTQVGYAGGDIPNPSYRDVCTGASKHNEVVRIVYDPAKLSYAQILKIFWDRHDPTSLNRQGNDAGTQYRSGIYYYNDKQKEIAEKTRDALQKSYDKEDAFGRKIVTEIVPAPQFYYAEDYHQQYDAKPGSRYYCGLSPTGVKLDLTKVDMASA